MKKEKWFLVKYGFGTMDKIAIQENELEKALYAHKFGEVVQLQNKQINGKYIISIEPHYHKYTGWYDSYEPKTGDDWQQIERDCPNDLDNLIRYYRERVDYLINTGRKNLIGKNIELPEIKIPEVKKIDTQRGGIKSIGEILR